MFTNGSKTWVLIGGVVIIAILVVAGVYRAYLGARAFPFPDLTETIVGGKLQGARITEGQHQLEFRAKTNDGKTVSDRVTFRAGTVAPTPPPSSEAAALILWRRDPARRTHYSAHLTVDLETREFTRRLFRGSTVLERETCTVLPEGTISVFRRLIQQFRNLPKKPLGDNFGRRGVGQEWITVEGADGITHYGAYADRTVQFPYAFQVIVASMKQLAFTYCVPPTVSPPRGHLLGD